MVSRIQDLVDRKQIQVKEGWWDTAMFVLAGPDHVADPKWCNVFRPAVVLRIVGTHSVALKHAFDQSEEVKVHELPIFNDRMRNSVLTLALPDVLEVLSHGRRVVGPAHGACHFLFNNF